VFKLLFKEVLQPAVAQPFLFRLAPLIALVPAFAAWAVVPFDAQVVLSNANAGLLYLLAMTSMGVYGVILAGWASNSKYAFLGAMRAAAQVVSYEIAMGFALVGVLIAAGSLNLSDIVMRRAAMAASSNGSCGRCCRCSWSTSSPAWPKPTARRSTWWKANRKSLPATCRVLRFAVRAVLPGRIRQHDPGQLPDRDLLRRWLAVADPGGLHPGCAGAVDRARRWLVVVAGQGVLLRQLFIWFRASFPRYRYDQIMRLGWKVFIPITIVWIFVTALLVFSGILRRRGSKPWVKSSFLLQEPAPARTAWRPGLTG
jgi:NADH-quinone oxidoreductase subunit H